MKFTEEQIAKFKADHGDDLHYLEVEDGKSCILKTPSRKVVGMAMSKARNNPLAIVEVVLANCWVAGDDEIKDADDGSYLMGLAEHIESIIGTKTVRLKKL